MSNRSQTLSRGNGVGHGKSQASGSSSKRRSGVLYSDQAQTEHLILLQTPVWIAAVGGVMLSGALHHWNDIHYLVFSVAAASPSILIPAFCHARSNSAQPWWNSYWFKLNVWVGIVVFFGTYIGTAYFFDLMGMRYNFDVQWNYSSDVVGKSGQQVPVFMYPLTHAYFMSYFVILVVVDRCIVHGVRLGRVGGLAVLLGLSYALAFAETYFMAAEVLSDFFLYEDRSRMLRVGSFGYATYFVVGLPVIRRMDRDGDIWTLQRVIMEALASCMAIMLLLELWSKAMGPL